MTSKSNWEIVDSMPAGWSIDKTCGSPVIQTVFITDGKSVLRGGKRMLLRVKPERYEHAMPRQKPETDNAIDNHKQKSGAQPFPARELHELARAKMRERILKDIAADMQVCHLEGWEHTEYIKTILTDIRSLLKGNKIK